MTFDLRLPIGLVFTLFGLMLTGYGAISDPGIYLNLIWGGVVLIFGLWMLIMALSARRKRHTGKP
jgi:hypothetical protein